MYQGLQRHTRGVSGREGLWLLHRRRREDLLGWQPLLMWHLLRWQALLGRDALLRWQGLVRNLLREGPLRRQLGSPRCTAPWHPPRHPDCLLHGAPWQHRRLLLRLLLLQLLLWQLLLLL